MYAPIIIPTLNRVEHLERCITSLKRNSLAAQTELYISLDYPPSEKYFVGFECTKRYLDSLNDGFKAIHKFYQVNNLGPAENINFLLREVFKKYEAYILTEDDNEFSPNFLEYINGGLERFSNDQTIFSICGYHDERSWQCINGNIMKINIYHAFGIATWKGKVEKCREWICRKNFEKFLHDKSFCKKLFSLSYKSYYTFIQSILANPEDQNCVYISKTGDIEMIDYTVNIYMLMNDLYTILPKVNMVRNWGNDGTGVNCAANAEYIPENIKIDADVNFKYIVPPILNMNRANTLIRREAAYKSLALQACCWRSIMCLFGLKFARRLRNMLYVVRTKNRKILKTILS